MGHLRRPRNLGRARRIGSRPLAAPFVLAHNALGTSKLALTWLALMESPRDAMVPARTAEVHWAAAGRAKGEPVRAAHLAQAHAAITRALARAYGPHRLRLHLLAADIEGARGGVCAERVVLDRAIAEGDAMKFIGHHVKVLERLRARRKAL